MKLVRTRVPEIIAREGRRATTHRAESGEAWALLLAKVEEETQELLEAESRRELIEELADLLEVLDAIQRSLGAHEEVERVKAFKLATRGPFENVVLHPPYQGVPCCSQCGVLAPSGRDRCPSCEALPVET